MITNKEDFRRYLEEDKRALHMEAKHPKPFSDEIWKFQRLLRKVEYWTNCRKDRVGKLFCKWYKFHFHRMSLKLGLTISPNCFEEGLSIAHYGCIVVHGRARIGKYCRIQEGVTVGATNGSKESAVLGDNVFLGSGAKIIGGIRIADRVSIGAGAVVVKDINEAGTTWGGVPAGKISDHGSELNIII